MDRLAQVRVITWQGGSLWVAETLASDELSRTKPHAHHTIQITINLDGRIRFKAGAIEAGGDAVAVAADALHLFEAKGLMAHLFIEPESRNGRTIARKWLSGADLAALPGELVSDIAPAIAANHRSPRSDDAALAALGAKIIDRLADGITGDAPDLRVRKMIAAARERLDGPVSLADFDGIGGLSASRLRHLFVEQTGLPFRTYLLWLRLNRAIECIVRGRTLTEAAHEAGFADSAHFSRTFTRMFGIPPATLRMS
ncbi:MAG TPA: AraC family transcriptional regulator [Allosphingosinicella sp.]|jgi:AraC-like DNA-binding protein